MLSLCNYGKQQKSLKKNCTQIAITLKNLAVDVHEEVSLLLMTAGLMGTMKTT